MKTYWSPLALISWRLTFFCFLPTKDHEGDVWPEAQRKLWLDTAASIFKMIYKDAPVGTEGIPWAKNDITK